MADPRFFSVAGPFSLAALAEVAKVRLGDAADPQATFADVAPIDKAGPRDVSFLDNKRYVEAFSRSAAGACVVSPAMADKAPSGMALLLTDQPYHAYARIAQAFYPMPSLEEWTAPNAVVDAGAIIGEGCRIEPGAVIGPGVEIGRNCHIGANAVIGAGVVIGDDGIIGANATISHAIIGRRAFIYPGVRIGQDGFGFAMSPLGHLKVPQLGRVIIHDDVEIGANTTIDRGAGPDTVIGAGCRIDNLVQIGHNVQLGRGCVIVAQVGISGSTRLDDFVAIGGQVGISGHLRIGAGAQVAAQSGVMRDVPAGKTMCGSPAIDARDYWRQTVVLSQLAKTKSRS